MIFNHRGRFLLLTFVVIIIVIIVTHDFTRAMLVISLVANYLIISSQLTMIQEDGNNGRSNIISNIIPTGSISGVGGGAVMESFGGPDAKTLETGLYGESSPGEYPGGIEFGYGDWNARDVIPAGNPYDTDNVKSHVSAPACIDDEAIALFDADESNTYQIRARNNHQRVVVGTIDRKKMLDPYVRQELEEEEYSQWMGRSEV